MQRPDLPAAPDSGAFNGSSSQLTDAQRQFADVIGRELARLWIEEQAATARVPQNDAPSRASPQGPSNVLTDQK